MQYSTCSIHWAYCDGIMTVIVDSIVDRYLITFITDRWLSILHSVIPDLTTTMMTLILSTFYWKMNRPMTDLCRSRWRYSHSYSFHSFIWRYWRSDCGVFWWWRPLFDYGGLLTGEVPENLRYSTTWHSSFPFYSFDWLNVTLPGVIVFYSDRWRSVLFPA